MTVPVSSSNSIFSSVTRAINRSCFWYFLRTFSKARCVRDWVTTLAPNKPFHLVAEITFSKGIFASPTIAGVPYLARWPLLTSRLMLTWSVR